MRTTLKLLTVLGSHNAGFTFDPLAATFTAAMAKRAGGVFAGVPIVQGEWDSTPVDALSATKSQIYSYWYTLADPYQGSIVLWYTPEYSFDAAHQLQYLYNDGHVALGYTHMTGSGYWQLAVNGQSNYTAIAHSLVAGTRYCIVVRWDSKRTLDGSNYACLSINDSHTFLLSGTPSVIQVTAAVRIGSQNLEKRSACGLIEGLTTYRRPLYDGTYGVDVGNGDEINLIYAAGAGKDPCLITGSWDVVFCLPTNATPGALATGTGEAWSHPHGSALLTDSWCQTTYGSSAWTTKGTPSTGPADIAAAANKVFAWGYEFEAGADADGIEQSLTGLTAGSNYVIRVIAHEDDGADIRVRVTDDTNSADIVTFLFGASSTVNAPGVALFTWELPTVARNGAAANCTAMTIAIDGTAAGQVVDVHQVELRTNLVDNPSMETGAVADPWIPDGWTNGGLDAGDSEKETAITHSGAASMQWNTGAVDGERIYIVPAGRAVGEFVAIGAHHYGDTTTGLRIGSSSASYLHMQYSLSAYRLDFPTGAAWTHGAAVLRIANVYDLVAIEGVSAASGSHYIDDVYAILLAAVSLTATPASAANSAESSGIRVDGRDRLTLALASIGATAGTARWSCRPRHAAANAVKFGNTPAYIASLYGAADNYIRVYWSAANTITLAFNDGGGAHTGTWDATGAIVANTEYEFTVRWTSAQMTLAVDGVTKITIAQPVSFATVPATFYAGSLSDGSGQGDAVFV